MNMQKSIKTKHITILYNLPNLQASGFSKADEDTQKTAHLVKQALLSLGMTVSLCPISPDTIGVISQIKADCIFNLIEWTGDDLPNVASVFQLLDQTGIPYTGAEFRNYFITAHKVAMKQCFSALGIPTAPYQSVASDSQPVLKDFHYPVIVKVAGEHCGIGLSDSSICQDEGSTSRQVKILREQFHQPIIVEEYISGKEYQVTMMEIDGKPKMLPVAEYVFASKNPYEILAYENRWVAGIDNCGFKVKIAKFPAETEKRLAKLSVYIFKSFNFRDYARFDIRIRDNNIYILEANSNPGLDDEMDNGLAVSFHTAGYTFATFLEQIIKSCLQRR
jgi:D-alanine-D-alanine ligase